MTNEDYQLLENYKINTVIVLENDSIGNDIQEIQGLVVERFEKIVILSESEFTETEISGKYIAAIEYHEFCELIEHDYYTKVTNVKLYNIDPADLPALFWENKKIQYLSLMGNDILSLPSEIGGLRNLRWLDLSYNQLSKLPSQIGQLINLEWLNLSYNNLHTLPKELAELTRLYYLDLTDNILKLPPEILVKVNEPQTILNYLSWLFRGKQKSLNETKMLVVGQGSVGKTSLMKRLIENKFDPNETKTDGISIDYWEVVNNFKTSIDFLKSNIGDEEEIQNSDESDIINNNGVENLEIDEQNKLSTNNRLKNQSEIDKTTLTVLPNSLSELEDDSDIENTFLEIQERDPEVEFQDYVLDMSRQSKIQINIWDFGGQEIMHATHQFFLTKRSLYLLVLDSRLTQEENRVEYWLKIIQLFGGDSPVLLVGNKIDQHPLDIDRTGLRKKYPNIVGILETSASIGTGIDELKSSIAEEVNKLPHIRDLLPEPWFKVKTILEEWKKRKNYISYEDYLELCAQNKVGDEFSQRRLISFFHDLGIVLHFQDDPHLEPLGILNPQWVTNGVYKIINSHNLFQNKGELAFSMLNEILDFPEYPRSKRLFIVDMMRKFELCYDIEPENTFLVPDLLPKDQPDLVEFDGVPAFEYSYPILPSSVITRFIVRMNHKIYKKLVWRTGVLLTIGENKALVKADIEDRKITISIDGLEHTRRETLAAIFYHLNDIHDSIKGLNPEKLVPVPSAENAKPIPYNYLLMLEAKGIEILPVPDGNRLIDVNIRKVLSGVPTEAQSTEKKVGGNVTTNIFVGGNFDGNLTIGDGNQSVKDSYNKATTAAIDPELKQTLLQLVEAVEIMIKPLPKEQSAEITEDLGKLVEEATKSKPNKKWYSVSIEGLIKAAENLDKLGTPVISLSRNVLSLLTGGVVK